MPAQIHLFPCLKDNYGVLLHDAASGVTAAIDAPEAAAVEGALKATGWRLTDILVTHHHADHTDGIPALKEHHRCRVVAPQAEAARIPLVDETVREHDTVRVGSLEGRVIETPGHTIGQVNYFFPADKLLFAGDTLFSIGCGRVIEGNPEMMWRSLLKLRALPDDTRVYCGHEYTQANIRFARTIEPDNIASGEIKSSSLRQLRPFIRPHARDQLVPAAIRFEHRRLAFAHIEPILAEGVHDVRLVRDDDDVAAGRRDRRGELTQCLRPPVILDRRDHEPAFGDVSSRLGFAEPKQRAGLDRPIEHAGVDLRDRDFQLAHRIADRPRQCAATVVELALLGDVADIERIGVGLVRMRRPMPEHDHMASAPQGINPFGLRGQSLAEGR
jgi:hydroxyacylglutathione hydrolase